MKVTDKTSHFSLIWGGGYRNKSLSKSLGAAVFLSFGSSGGPLGPLGLLDEQKRSRWRLRIQNSENVPFWVRYGRRLAALARPHAGAMYSRRPAALTLPHGGRPEAGIRCGRSSYPASIVCLRAKHGSRPKYAFGERIHAGRTCLHAILISCEHSLLAGEACLQTKVCIRRENSCRQDMPACYPHILRA